jgi:DNA end-binding protein Ku
MRSMWKGSIGFGLVNIPVHMYTATEESNISFSQYDKKDHAKVRYKKVNENTGKELSQEDIVRGYDLHGNIVIVEESDFAKAMPEKLDHLEILQFVDEKEIDAVYYEKPYYLEPDKVGLKAYALLRDALTIEGKVGLGLLVYHNKEWLCLIKTMRKVLVMHRLRFSDEIRSEKGLQIPDIEVKKDELKMASMLVAQLTKPFKPEEYKDTYSEKLMGVIEAKAKGKAPKTMKVVHNATTTDLMDKLKASLKSKTKKAS